MIFASSALALLAACGGGGSGAEEFSSFSSVDPNGTVTLDGTTRPATASTDDSGDASLDAIQSDDDATATISLSDDVPTRLAIRGTAADATIDENSGGTITANNSLITGKDDTTTVVLANPTPDNSSYQANYQTYGLWANANIDGALEGEGVGSFGARTGEANMPANGDQQAVFYGNSIGILDDGGSQVVTASRVQVETNFSQVEFLSENTKVIEIDTGNDTKTAGELNFRTVGTVSGDGFNIDINEPVGTGTLDGQFYGPNAEEVGGTFEILTSETKGTYVAAFGALQ